MLSVYTRHCSSCPRNNIHYRRCPCPKWIQGTLEQRHYFRVSVKTRNWRAAERKAHEMEKAALQLPEPQPIAVTTAIRAFRLAGIKNADGRAKRCHSHMFHDTFAVELLLSGIPIDQVSILLGHRSVKMTEKHYLPCVKRGKNNSHRVFNGHSSPS